jgi:hypothetical protein
MIERYLEDWDLAKLDIPVHQTSATWYVRPLMI